VRPEAEQKVQVEVKAEGKNVGGLRLEVRGLRPVEFQKPLTSNLKPFFPPPSNAFIPLNLNLSLNLLRPPPQPFPPPPATSHSPLTTLYSPLTTSHSPLTTSYSPLPLILNLSSGPQPQRMSALVQS